MLAQRQVQALMQDYRPDNLYEKRLKQQILAFVAQHEHFWSRQTPAGHLTASAWITNPEQTQALLMHHKKLDIWVQPGGHIEAEDTSLAGAARREAYEESGIRELTQQQPGVFDVDIHTIPARGNELEHSHLDIRFWFVAHQLEYSQNDEAHQLAWVSAANIAAKTTEESVLRMVRKSLHIR